MNQNTNKNFKNEGLSKNFPTVPHKNYFLLHYYFFYFPNNFINIAIGMRIQPKAAARITFFA